MRYRPVFLIQSDSGMARGKEAVDKICDDILTLFDQGGTLLNINIINAQQILAANENPDLFPDLVGRPRDGLYGVFLPADARVPQAGRGPHLGCIKTIPPYQMERNLL